MRRRDMYVKSIPALLLAVGASAAPMAMIVDAADAASKPMCHSGKITIVESKKKDQNRAYAVCSVIDARTKVRAKLKRTLQSDINGSWFVNEDVTHYTAKAACAFSCSGGAEWKTR
jgi:hypothetical protein